MFVNNNIIKKKEGHLNNKKLITNILLVKTDFEKHFNNN